MWVIGIIWDADYIAAITQWCCMVTVLLIKYPKWPPRITLKYPNHIWDGKNIIKNAFLYLYIYIYMLTKTLWKIIWFQEVHILPTMESGEEKNSKRKWMVLAASTMIQAFSGTNFDFSSYSLDYKYVLCISQSQLNYLSMASDFGKFFGWCSGLSLQYFSLRVVLLISAFLGLFGYGLQWLLISNLISLPYFMVNLSFYLFFLFQLSFNFLTETAKFK